MLSGCGDGSGQSPPVNTPPIQPTPSPTPAPSPTPTPTPTPTRNLVIAVGGSSSPQQYLSQFEGPTASNLVRVSRDGSTYEILQKGAFGKSAGQSIASALGRPVDFIDGGVVSTTLQDWAADNSPQRLALVNSIRSSGGADIVLLQVGRNDAAFGLVKSREQQLELLRKVITTIRATASIPNALVILGACQDLHNDALGRQSLLSLQRLAELDAASTIPNVAYGFSTYDLPTYDGIHQTEQAQLLSGARFAEQVIAWGTKKTLPRGPRGIAAKRVNTSSTDVMLEVFGDVGFTPASGIDGFYIQDASGISRVQSAVKVDNRTIRLQHRETDNEVAYVRYALDADLVSTSCVKDVSSTQRPMEPLLAALT